MAGCENTSKLSEAAGGVLDAFDQARQAIMEIAASMAEVVQTTAAGPFVLTTSKWPSGSSWPPPAR